MKLHTLKNLLLSEFKGGSTKHALAEKYNLPFYKVKRLIREATGKKPEPQKRRLKW